MTEDVGRFPAPRRARKRFVAQRFSGRRGRRPLRTRTEKKIKHSAFSRKENGERFAWNSSCCVRKRFDFCPCIMRVCRGRRPRRPVCVGQQNGFSPSNLRELGLFYIVLPAAYAPFSAPRRAWNRVRRGRRPRRPATPAPPPHAKKLCKGRIAFAELLS